jgi:hypothetical protein
MKDGKLYSSGGIVMPGKGEKLDWKPEEMVVDALGNESKAKAPKKKLSNKDKKKAAKVCILPQLISGIPTASRTMQGLHVTTGVLLLCKVFSIDE